MSDHTTRRDARVRDTLEAIDALIGGPCWTCGDPVGTSGPSDLFCSAQCQRDGLEHPSDGTSEESTVADDEWEPEDRSTVGNFVLSIDVTPSQTLVDGQSAWLHANCRFPFEVRDGINGPVVASSLFEEWRSYRQEQEWFQRVHLNRETSAAEIPSPATDHRGHHDRSP